MANSEQSDIFRRLTGLSSAYESFPAFSKPWRLRELLSGGPGGGD